RTSRADFEADLRIGIHLGDITIENNDVYGDGVNVAARLESIADPSGIYISESIEKAIRGQSKIQAKFLGEVKLKNVDYNVRTYAIQGVGLPVPKVKDDNELSGHFFAEVQRRGIIRAGVTYVVLSLLFVLIIPYGESLVNLPSWTTNVLFICLVVGFPVALYLAWNYERSPEGFVKTDSKKSWRNPYSTAKRKPFTSNLVLSILLLCALSIFSYTKFIAGGSETSDSEVKRFHILFPEQAPLSLLGEAQNQWSYSSMALSPDGKILIYAGWRNGRSLLYLRYINETEVIPIEGTEGAYGPFFSPDGKWIAFSTPTILKKVMIPDGSPVDITPVVGSNSAAVWLKNDNIIFSGSRNIFTISSRGGTPELLSIRKENRVVDLVGGYTTGIDVTPDQKHILFSDLAGDIYSLSLQSKKTTLIYPGAGGSPKYIPSGHLIFSRNNAIFAVPFDLKTMSPLGNENQ
ncbi:MAG: PD40 domain-containing protein, partial [Cyclobacteriaceae bacterium]|nr:PD40 domain-containing protein [Cyclobacteriaceae bacterium]